MGSIYLVCGREDSYEPIEWYVVAFREKRRAESLVKKFTKAMQAVGDELSEFRAKNEEPEIDDDSGAYDAWADAMQKLREKHPDEHSHVLAGSWTYYIAKIPLR